MKKMKACIYIIMILAFLLVGCSDINSRKNTQLSENHLTDEPEKLNMSDIYNWDNAMIKDIGYYPKIEGGAIVQNDEYIFFPQNGNKVIRLNKSSKEEKIIMEFDDMGDEAIGDEAVIGVRFCLTESGLYIEYAGDIYTSDFEGNNVSKILSGSEMEKMISDIMNDDIYDSGDIMALEYYQDNLYLCLRFNVLMRLDIETKKVVKVAADVEQLCFCDNDLYYIGSGLTAIYKVNLSTLKRKRVRGKEIVMDDVDAEKRYYYEEIMEVDGEIYYIKYQMEKPCAIYKYSNRKEDKEVFDYNLDAENDRFWVAYSALPKIICEYATYDERGDAKTYLKIYDISTGIMGVVKTPDDYETIAFLAGDIIFYSTSENEYLSFMKF